MTITLKIIQFNNAWYISGPLKNTIIDNYQGSNKETMRSKRNYTKANIAVCRRLLSAIISTTRLYDYHEAVKSVARPKRLRHRFRNVSDAITWVKPEA